MCSNFSRGMSHDHRLWAIGTADLTSKPGPLDPHSDRHGSRHHQMGRLHSDPVDIRPSTLPHDRYQSPFRLPT